MNAEDLLKDLDMSFTPEERAIINSRPLKEIPPDQRAGAAVDAFNALEKLAEGGDWE